MPNSVHQIDKSPAGQNPIRWLYYVGMSMYPTLRNLDILTISPVERKDIRRGDVVVFKSPISGRMISHRVVAIKKESLRTAGDNMTTRDSALTRYDSIIGRIDFLDRGLKTLPVRNGFSGLFRYYMTRLRKNIPGYSFLKSYLRFLWKQFTDDKPTKSGLTDFGEVKVYLFNYPDAPVGRLFLGDLVIGKTTNDLTNWEIDPKHINAVDLSMIPAPITFLNNRSVSKVNKLRTREP